MILLILHQLLNEIAGSRSESLCIGFAISVDHDIAMLKSGLKAIEADLFVGFAEVREMLFAENLEELDEFFFFEGRDY